MGPNYEMDDFKFQLFLEVESLDIHRQVKINDKNEQRFSVVMTPLSSSE